jgi:hypothetical protein
MRKVIVVKAVCLVAVFTTFVFGGEHRTNDQQEDNAYDGATRDDAPRKVVTVRYIQIGPMLKCRNADRG